MLHPLRHYCCHRWIARAGTEAPMIPTERTKPPNQCLLRMEVWQRPCVSYTLWIMRVTTTKYNRFPQSARPCMRAPTFLTVFFQYNGCCYTRQKMHRNELLDWEKLITNFFCVSFENKNSIGASTFLVPCEVTN